MQSREFLRALEMQLRALPRRERRRILEYYDELITDACEEGEAQDVVVARQGNVEEVAAGIVSSMAQPGRRKASLVLMILGAPFALIFTVVALCVLIALTAAVWSTLLSLYAAAVYMAVAPFLYLVGGIVGALPWPPLALGPVSVGLGLLLFVGMLALTKPIARLTGKAYAELFGFWFRRRRRWAHA